jgi:hypothetical protein
MRQGQNYGANPIWQAVLNDFMEAVRANRCNALRSTGPRTTVGKEVSRRNALRHGLTAETVIGALEDAEDYEAFEAAIAADYDAQSGVEGELVLRLASLLWRLRRATTIETGLFEIHAKYCHDDRQNLRQLTQSQNMISPAATCELNGGMKFGGTAIEFASCFLRLANLPNFALDRPSRYEATLWRQAGRILYALETLDRRKPQERSRRLQSLPGLPMLRELGYLTPSSLTWCGLAAPAKTNPEIVTKLNTVIANYAPVFYPWR